MAGSIPQRALSSLSWLQVERNRDYSLMEVGRNESGQRIIRPLASITEQPSFERLLSRLVEFCEGKRRA